MFEWDEAKRAKTIAERGLDFIDAALAFDGRPAVHVPARLGDEDRFLTIARIEGKFHTVVWTWRGVNRRIVSFRRSRREEERAYRQILG
jgi:uncharacterized DUF497 family protein